MSSHHLGLIDQSSLDLFFVEFSPFWHFSYCALLVWGVFTSERERGEYVYGLGALAVNLHPELLFFFSKGTIAIRGIIAIPPPRVRI